jgi:hypothetical protein
MHINGKIVGSIAGAAPVGEARAERSSGSQAAVPAAPAQDSVVISDAGRALSSKDSSVADLDPRHEAAIRQRIVDGAYDSLEIVDQVARRILESGDL